MLTHTEFKNRILSHEKPEFCLTITEPLSPIYLEASCANVLCCSVQISLGIISSFMRVCITAGMIKSENIARISFFLRILCVNTAVLSFTMLSRLRISIKLY